MASTLIAEEAYSSLEPIAAQDEANGFPLRALMRAIGTMFAQPEEAIRARGDGLDSWERVFDPDLAPDWLLPFIGLAVGVTVNTAFTPAQQREQIKEEGGWHRGRPAALLGAVAATLTGGKSIRLVERNSTPWTALLITRPSETPNPVVTKNAALSQKPGGMIYTLEESDLPLIDEGVVKTIDECTVATINTVTLAQIS